VSALPSRSFRSVFGAACLDSEVGRRCQGGRPARAASILPRSHWPMKHRNWPWCSSVWRKNARGRSCGWRSTFLPPPGCFGSGVLFCGVLLNDVFNRHALPRVSPFPDRHDLARPFPRIRVVANELLLCLQNRQLRRTNILGGTMHLHRCARPTSSGASGLEAATPGCCLRLHVSNHRLIRDFILSSL
jgi:hypothetical protein